MSIKIVNLTPHPINVVGDEGQTLATFPKCDNPARMSMSHVLIGRCNDIPIYRVEYGPVENVPEFSDDVEYIVSGFVKSALPWRTDLLQPGQLVRDKEGRVIGCKGLIV